MTGPEVVHLVADNERGRIATPDNRGEALVARSVMSRDSDREAPYACPYSVERSTQLRKPAISALVALQRCRSEPTQVGFPLIDKMLIRGKYDDQRLVSALG